MRPVSKIIEDAYVVFAPYTLGLTLDVCKMCCVSDEEERELLATPLREVSRQLLQNAYYESARNYSDRERWEMKHFVPRVLELVSHYEFPCHSDELTFTRLDLNLTVYWPLAERKLLNEFALAYTKRNLQQYPLPKNTNFSDMLVMFGIGHFELAPLLQLWTTTTTLGSLLYFVDLLLDDSHALSNGIVKFTNSFSEPHVNKQLTTWLTDRVVRVTWRSRLEETIMQGQLSPEHTERVSWAYDVLTHGLPAVTASAE